MSTRSSPHASIRAKALEAGARAFLLKQDDDDAFLASLASALSGK